MGRGTPWCGRPRMTQPGLPWPEASELGDALQPVTELKTMGIPSPAHLRKHRRCPQAKDMLIEKIQDYLEQKIRFADRMLVKHAIEKIQVGPRAAGAARFKAPAQRFFFSFFFPSLTQ